MNLAKKLTDPCNKCVVDLVCKNICPDRISYSLFIEKTGKFIENLTMWLVYLNCVFITTSWALSIDLPKGYGPTFLVLYIINAAFFLFSNVNLKRRVGNINYERFKLSYYDISELNKRIKEEEEEELKNTERR